MPAKKTTRHKRAASSNGSRQSGAKALAMSEPVLRGSVLRESLSPTFFQPVSLAPQLGLMRAMAAWSPLGVLVGQQAAFWKGFAESVKTPAKVVKRGRRSRPSTGKRARA
jgi:hypothetical protein